MAASQLLTGSLPEPEYREGHAHLQVVRVLFGGE